MPAPEHTATRLPPSAGRDDARAPAGGPKMQPPSLADMSPEDWLSALEDLGDEHGDYAPVGAKHHKLFLDFGRTLLVTFEMIGEARARPHALPRGVDLAMARNWSLLAFLSDGETWFRDRAVWGTMDRLSDDGFFDDFDRVLFFGAGAGGYAACALSVAAPGARVLALRPQATLTPQIAGWDRRFPHARRVDFTSRYGYGPDMIDAAEHVDILIDPKIPLDAIHASLYTRSNVTVHPLPHAGMRIETTLDRLGLMPDLIDLAMAGDLTPARLGRMWRKRRDYPSYLRVLLRKAEEAGRKAMVRHICRFGMTTADRAFFAGKLAALDAKAP